MRLALFVLLVACAPSLADGPAHVIIIRHAEKPQTGTGLSRAGKARAAALPQLFVKSADPPDPLPKPDFIIAAATSDESNRPADTVDPIAKELRLTVKADIKDKHPEKVAEELKKEKYAGKTVLICWHHGKMPELAKDLGGTGIPKKIGEGVYDLMWRLDLVGGEVKTTLGTQDLKIAE